MRGQDLLIVLLYAGCGSASPYYYRESKHQSEHHKEYSYGGNGNSETSQQIPVSFTDDELQVPQVSLSGKPERYSMLVYPSQASGYSQSYTGGGYSFGQGGSVQQGLNPQQYSSIKPAPLVSGEYSHFSSPLVVKHKIVKVYSYPSTSSQSGYYHFSKTGSGLYGSDDSIKPVQSERLVRQKEESHHSQRHTLGGDDFQIGQKEPSVDSTWDGRSYGEEFARSAEHDIGQNPVEGDLEVGQEESLHKPTDVRYIQSGHRVQRIYGHLRRGDLESGQREESFGGIEEPVPRHTSSYQQSQHYSQAQTSESLYQNPVKDELLDLGQKEESPDQLEIGQREEPVPKHSYQHSHHNSQSHLDVGQKEESLHKPTNIRYIQSGHRVQRIYGHRERDDLESGQGENLGIMEESVPSHSSQQSHYSQAQTSESLYQHPVKDELLDLGQKEESPDQLEIGQREEPVPKHSYQHSHHNSQSHLDVGQKEESLHKPTNIRYIQSGHRVQRIYGHRERDDLESGQGENLGIMEESVPSHSSQQSHYSQAQTSESLYQHPVKDELLDLGQKEESPDQLEIGQREEPVPKHSYQQSHYNSQSHLDVGQKEESLYQNPVKDEFLDLGQKEENVGQLEIGQREEPVLNQNYKQTKHYSYSHKVEVGAKEDSLYKKLDDIGQKEESIGQLEIGQTKESVFKENHKQDHHHSEGETVPIGQKEPSLYDHNYKASGAKKEDSLYPDQQGVEPLQGLNYESHQKREESHLTQESGHLEVGQRKEPNGFPEKPESSTKQPLDVFGQGRERLDQNKYSSLELGHKHLPLPSTIVVTSHKREESYQKHEGGALGLGQREVPLLKQIPNDLSHKERTASVHLGKYGNIDLGQEEEPFPEPGQVDVGQEEEKESFSEVNKMRRLGEASRGVVLVPVYPVESHQPKPDYYGGLASAAQEHSSSHQTETHGYHHGFSSENMKPCDHGQQYQHGGYGAGQTGHIQQIRNVWERESSVSHGEKTPEGMNKLYTVNWGHNKNNGRQGLIYSSSTSSKNVTKVQKSTPQQPLLIPGKDFSSTQTINLDKKVDDLAKLLEFEGISKEPSSVVTDNAQTVLVPTGIHNAEIQELGSENFDIPTSLEPLASRVTPERKLNIYETHKEEIGYDYPSSQRTYSKKHSSHYSVREESHSGTGQKVEPIGQLLSNSGKSSGEDKSSAGWYSFSRHGYSSSSNHGDIEGASHHGHRISRQSDRQATIDSFLSELDKDIARDNKKAGGQGGYVQVSQQNYNSGVPTTRITTTSSTSSQGSSWFKKLGDNISSSYNKAKDKAKEIVASVKHSVSS